MLGQCYILALINGLQMSSCCVVKVGDICNQEVGREIFVALKEQFFLSPEALLLNLLKMLEFKVI